MSRILIAVLVFSFTTAAQFYNKNLIHSKKKVHTEVFSLLRDSVYKCYFLFQIPNSSLVFEKENSKFISRFEIDLEIKNSNEQVVQRKFSKDIIELNDYEKTISENEFIINFIELELAPDTFLCNVTFTDLITGKPFDIYHQKLDLVRTKDSPRWLLIKPNQSNGSGNFEVGIFGNIIPHSQNNYDLFLTGNFDLSKVEKVKVKSDDTVFVNYEFISYANVSPKLHLQNNKILLELVEEPSIRKHKSTSTLTDSCSNETRSNVLVIKNINEKLFEGKYSLVLYGSNESQIKEIPISVIWIDKPKSLTDYDSALEMIEFIEVDESYRTYFSSEAEKKNKLFNYWKQKDPTPSTSFNELMYEFYTRVDYAQKEFISVSQRNGAKTDRGKVLILNGRPERIERSVNSYGKVIESWYYDKPERVFTFIDSRGDGNFKSLQ
jgi:GWxTD domain-containing protein